MSTSLSLEEQVIAALRRISRAIDLHSRLLLQKYGLTSPQLAALQAIHRLQPVSVGTLARVIHLSPATVTGILGRLEARGHVTRERYEWDRRSVVVRLTEEGVRLVEEAPSLLHERFHERLSELREWEQTMILAILQRIASMMDAEKLDAAPFLVSGGISAPEDNSARYLEKGVASTDRDVLANESASATEAPLSGDGPESIGGWPTGDRQSSPDEPLKRTPNSRGGANAPND